MHRDIKTANILVTRSGVVMIADFGLARAWTSNETLPEHSTHEYTNMVVTRWYRAPELLLGATHYGPAVDMWSLGFVDPIHLRRLMLTFPDAFWEKYTIKILFLWARAIETSFTRFSRSVGRSTRTLSLIGTVFQAFQTLKIILGRKLRRKCPSWRWLKSGSEFVSYG